MSRTMRIVRLRQRHYGKRKRGARAGLRWFGSAALVALMGTAAAALVGWMGGTAVYAALTADLPEYDQLTQIEETAVAPTQLLAWTDADQTKTIIIDEIIPPLNGERRWLTLDDIPQTVIDAAIAAEQPDFWTADFHLWQSEPNTIVQQAVRQSAIGNRQSAIKEQLLAHRAFNSYSREQILAWYLNGRYYGNLAFGIEAAARVYFAKPLADLTLAEAALLAASSAAINPIDAPEQAKIEQEAILAAMVEAGWISQTSAAAAEAIPLQLAAPAANANIIAPHFARHARQELARLFTPEELLAGGLQVYTSLNLELQGQAECAARAHINRLSGQIGPALPADEMAGCKALDYLPPLDTAVLGLNQQVDNTAVVILDAKTAEIRALVGSVNYWETPFNMAVDGRRQPGTAFVPITYLTALSQGYTAATMALDVPTDFGVISGVPYQPQNQDGGFHGPMRLREALGNGYNIPAIQVASWVGMDKVVSAARNLGLTALQTDDAVLSLNLGGGETSLLDMTYAYAVLANMGVMVGQTGAGSRPLDPVAIARVEDQSGSVLYDYYRQVQQRDILSPQLAYLMNDILTDRSARCAAFGCPNAMELPANRPAAVKTGSTNDFRDAWTIGYTPQLVTGVWVGNSDNSVMGRGPFGVTGVNGAAPIWQAAMAWAMQDEPVVLWSQPPGLVETAVCDISGLLATEHCPAVSELFIQGTQPTIPDAIYQELAVNRETGRLATVYTPPELVENRIYKVYPEAAAAWAKENGVELPPTEYDTIEIVTAVSQNTAVISPEPFAVISGTVPVRGTAQGDNFAYYRLAYFPGFAPENIQIIAEDMARTKENGVLGRWDTRGLDGLYTLLLTVVGEDGRFEEVSIPVTVSNDE
ncbi:MAG: hypothetical protein GY803_14265 [Chloroflexi bacterium]|nr:hypothetical protein [Chloroflexota bacterium]